MRTMLGIALALVMAGTVTASGSTHPQYDGSDNNARHDAWGRAGTPYRRVAASAYADQLGRMVRRPEGPLPQQPDLQRCRPESLFRERHLAVGLGLGSVHRPRHGSARRDPRRGGEHPVRRGRSTRGLQGRSRCGRVRPDTRRPGTGVSNAAPAGHTDQLGPDASHDHGIDPARSMRWLLAPDGASLLLPDEYLQRAGDKGRRLRDGQVRHSVERAQQGDRRAAYESLAQGVARSRRLFVVEHSRLARPTAIAAAEDARPDRRRVVGAESRTSPTRNSSRQRAFVCLISWRTARRRSEPRQRVRDGRVPSLSMVTASSMRLPEGRFAQARSTPSKRA